MSVLQWYDTMTAHARNEDGFLTYPSGSRDIARATSPMRDSEQQDDRKEPMSSAAITRRDDGGCTASPSHSKHASRRGEASRPSPGRVNSPSIQRHADTRECHSNQSSRMDVSEAASGASDISTGSEYARHHRYDACGVKSSAVLGVAAAGRSVAGGKAAVNAVCAHTSDPYDRKREMDNQDRFISESKRIGKPFIASGGTRTLEKPTRMLLGDFVRELYRIVLSDWARAAPIVVSTAEDLIVVFFATESLSVRQERVLLNYMNASLLHNQTMRRFLVDKVTEGWHMRTDDGYLMYTLRPPWVKKRHFLPPKMMRTASK